MARSTRRKSASTGPGRGSPRTRTSARPGERAAAQRARKRASEPEATASEKPVLQRDRALGVTWRLVMLGVVTAALAVTLAQSLRVYFEQAHEIALLRTEIQESTDKISELEDEIARWDDPEYVKAQARERLGWVLPGETGYRVIGLDGKPLGGDSTVFGKQEASGLWWERMWGSVQQADQPVAEKSEADSQLSPEPSASPSKSN